MSSERLAVVTNSKAPTSQPEPWGRATPRWSIVIDDMSPPQAIESPELMAPLPESSARVSVGPPLFASGPSGVPLCCWDAADKHVVSLVRLLSPESFDPSDATLQLFGVPFTKRLFSDRPIVVLTLPPLPPAELSASVEERMSSEPPLYTPPPRPSPPLPGSARFPLIVLSLRTRPPSAKIPPPRPWSTDGLATGLAVFPLIVLLVTVSDAAAAIPPPPSRALLPVMVTLSRDSGDSSSIAPPVPSAPAPPVRVTPEIAKFRVPDVIAMTRLLPPASIVVRRAPAPATVRSQSVGDGARSPT